MSTPLTDGAERRKGRDLPPLDTLVERFAPLAQQLERVSEALIDQIVQTIRDDVPGFAQIPYRGLRETIAVPVRRGIQASKGNVTAAPAELEEAVVIGREAAHFGLRAEDLLQAMRVGVRIFWAECVDWAAAHEFDPATLIAAADLIGRWVDDVSLAMVRGHREVSVEDAVHVERERFAFLQRLLHGTLASEELGPAAEHHGLAPDRLYVPVRARAFGSARSPAQCERAIRHDLGSAGSGIVLCALGSELIGVVPRRPEIDDPEILIGIGPPTPLEGIAASYSDAVRAFEVGARFGLRGTRDLGDLSLLVPIASQTSVGRRLVERYLKPLRDGSKTGAELERTLRSYLDNRFNAEATAHALPAHVNTVRARLQRLQQLLGGDFREPARLAELWWALQYDKIATQTVTGVRTAPVAGESGIGAGGFEPPTSRV